MDKVLPPPLTIAFDVYGTLVDPLAMHNHLAAIVGVDRAGEAAALWRRTQVEYSFRRGLMGPERYVDFDQCTAQALRFTLVSYGIDPGEETARALLDAYRTLPAFPDTVPGLRRVREAGHRLLAFSNGPEASVRAVLDHATCCPCSMASSASTTSTPSSPILTCIHIWSSAGAERPEQTWLVTANAWDAIGAKAAGHAGCLAPAQPGGHLRSLGRRLHAGLHRWQPVGVSVLAGCA